MKKAKRLLSMTVIVVTVISTLKYTQYEKAPDDWRLILVNENHAVPQDYEPELMELSDGIRIDERIYPDLQRMFDDARNDGVYPIVGEGYRTYEEQIYRPVSDNHRFSGG